MKLSGFSYSTRAEVDPNGLVIREINVDNGNPSNSPTQASQSKYSSRVHNIVNSVIPSLGEKIVAQYVGGKLFRGISHDVEMPDARKVEVKTGRVGSSVAIREGQLEQLGENDLYALLYYKTTHNRQRPPAYYVSKCIQENMKVSPEQYLLRNITFQSLFIIQRPSIVNFFNTSKLRLFHNSSGIPYKSLSRTSVYKLIQDNPDNFEILNSQFTFGKHTMEVIKMGNNL